MDSLHMNIVKLLQNIIIFSHKINKSESINFNYLVIKFINKQIYKLFVTQVMFNKTYEYTNIVTVNMVPTII